MYWPHYHFLLIEAVSWSSLVPEEPPFRSQTVFKILDCNRCYWQKITLFLFVVEGKISLHCLGKGKLHRDYASELQNINMVKQVPGIYSSFYHFPKEVLCFLFSD